MFAFIWAESSNHVIGNQGKMPWHISDDLKYFKRTTLNHPVIMGRKTFASFGSKPLPKRENIVLTHQDIIFSESSVTVVHDLDKLLAREQRKPTELFFVIGGAQIFTLFKPYVTQLFVTRIHRAVDGDTFMPTLPWSEFALTKQTPGLKNEQWPHTFEIYQRQKDFVK
ncbi:dihydrofolate reductase [Agrilactobacillus fermenti]|uniref:dihydrofolate reductase n=1 Tax=Agrilactobacillus fermenti TaxID=2586909 RepID=UPI001E44792C|nr:dihydrofolate reductase [Agrilactobacillus fermenti]MCD2257525.1 dihydrofolate reductase [Agrilactobacillus fermenti]